MDIFNFYVPYRFVRDAKVVGYTLLLLAVVSIFIKFTAIAFVVIATYAIGLVVTDVRKLIEDRKDAMN